MHPFAWRRLAPSLLGLLLLLASSRPAAALGPLDLDVGVKGGVNAALLLVEDRFDNNAVRGLFKDEDSFGLGGGGGLYLEARLLDRVGLELDLLYSHDTLHRTESWNGGVVDLEHTQWADNLRLPLLLKGYQSLGLARLSLGAGIEWVHPLDQGYDVERSAGAQVDFSSYRDSFDPQAEDSWFLVGQLELAFDLGLVQIPVDLRVGRNLSQGDTFEDRYDYTLTGNTITHVELHNLYSWDFRLLTGLAFSF